MNFPNALKNDAWQAKKTEALGKIAVKLVKTGLGEELKKAERVHQGIQWKLFEGNSLPQNWRAAWERGPKSLLDQLQAAQDQAAKTGKTIDGSRLVPDLAKYRIKKYVEETGKQCVELRKKIGELKQQLEDADKKAQKQSQDKMKELAIKAGALLQKLVHAGNTFLGQPHAKYLYLIRTVVKEFDELSGEGYVAKDPRVFQAFARVALLAERYLKIVMLPPTDPNRGKTIPHVKKEMSDFIAQTAGLKA